MTQLWFPGLTFNGLTITRGQLLNVSLLGIGLVIPPIDLKILPAVTFWEPFLLIDSDWIVKPLSEGIAAIPKALIDFVSSTLEDETKKYYEEHPERKPK